MSEFVLDASYALTWCFTDRGTPATEAVFGRMEARLDRAFVPWIWPVEVSNALGKAVTRGRVPMHRAVELWEELEALPIRQVAIGNIPELPRMAVRDNLSLYDTCYLRCAEALGFPLATKDKKLAEAASSIGLAVWAP